MILSGSCHHCEPQILTIFSRGTTIAKIVSENTVEHPNVFEPTVRMWVHEEKIDGKNLTEIINEQHENVKYLASIKLPTNLVAVPSIVEAARDADILVFNAPHQFLGNICRQLKGHVKPTARAISCLKGLNVSKEECSTLSDYITKELGIHCGALSGANIALEIAQKKYSETTIGYRLPSDYIPGEDVNQEVLYALFHRPYFHVNVIEDVTGVCLAGALKNVVAIAAGFVDGLGWGDNAKAAIMRRGLIEMVIFSQTFFVDCSATTFTRESAGVADLITSCAGGRNVRMGREFARQKKPLKQLEAELLNGQSAQGIITAREVYEFLEARNSLDKFPLLASTYNIAFNGLPIEELPAILGRYQTGASKL